MSVEKDIADYLNAGGIGILGTDLFANGWKEDADKQILVLSAQGFQSEDQAVYENPGFQILVRGDTNESPEIVKALAKTVYDYLINAGGRVTINSTDYHGFIFTNAPYGIGYDENERYNVTMNGYTYRNSI